MKNKIFNGILFSIFSILLAVCSVLYFGNKNSIVEAEDLPSYFNAYIANNNNDSENKPFSEKYTKKSSGGDIANGNSYFISTEEVVVISLNQKDNQTTETRIDQVASYEIVVNGQKVAPNQETNAMQVYENTGIIEFLIKNNDKTIFGEYQIGLTYYERTGAVTTYKQIDFRFTILNKSAYLINDSTNNTTFNKTYTTNNGIYARTVYFNYTSKGLESGSVLPTLTYDKEKFSIVLTKNVSGGLSFTQTISYDGTNVITSGDEVLQKVDIVELEGKSVKLVFNDVGSYIIEYRYLFTYDSQVSAVTIANYTAKADKIDVFGYQINYSNFETGKYSEMKVRNQELVDTINAVDFTYAVDSSKNDTEIWNAIKDKIKKTNQPLINFITSKSRLDETRSLVYKINSDDNLSTGEPFDNTPIGDVGKYFVKIVYTYNDFNGNDLGTIIEGTRYFVQYFAFEITEDMPDFSIEAIYTDDDGKEISTTTLANDSFTNKNVRIKKQAGYDSVYYAPTKIVVEQQKDFNGTYQEIPFSDEMLELEVKDSARYKVSLYFGRNNEKGFTTFFTIDKDEIQGVSVNTLLAISDRAYIRDGIVDFFTNQSVAIDWQNKISGAKVHASYKLIPLDKTYKTYDSSTLGQFYGNDKSVPTPYAFNCPNTLIESDCFNADTFTYISSERILSSEGLYIVRIYDDAGNEKLFAFIIDRTPAQALVEYNNGSNREYLLSSEPTIMSDDFAIALGQYKVIEFNNYTKLEEDEWFKNISESKTMNSEDKYSSFFKRYYTPNGMFARVLIDNQIVYTEDGTVKITDISSNDYKINIEFKEVQDGTLVALEHQYIFYVLDKSSTKRLSGHDRVSIENAKENYSGIKEVETSSDASQTKLSYKDINGNIHNLAQVVTEIDDSGKTTYYSPISTSIINASEKNVLLTFNAEPSKNKIEVSNISYRFAPFEKKIDQGKLLPTLTFSNYSSSITIYDKYDSSALKATLNNATGLYEWFVNEYYNTKTNKLETKPGKYEITRIYDTSLLGSDGDISDRLDYITRKFVFIVDDNEIISYPEEYQDDFGNNVLISTIGGANRVKVGGKYFNNLYIAKNMERNAPILTTNMLPVVVQVPAFKYGYLGNDGKFIAEDSVNKYGSTPIYNLSAKIHYAQNPDYLDARPEMVYASTYDESKNWLLFKDAEGKEVQFKKEGYYKVIISQGDNTFTYVFNISYQKPTFEITKYNNAEIYSNSSTYYTNEKSVKVSWIDDSSEFMAKINKDEIYYSINGGNKVKVLPELITTSGFNNSFNLDLEKIGAYTNGANIEVFMQYEGSANDYPEEYFMTSKTIVVDTLAPTDNLNKLINLSGINSDELRLVEETYNITTTTGVYQNFSFALDISNLQNVITFNKDSLFDTYQIHYKQLDSSSGYKALETNINSLKTSLHTNIYDYNLFSNIGLDQYVGKYYEFVEVDRAGNITVYSIYFYDSSAKQDTKAIEYSYNKNNGDNTKGILVKDITPNMYLYSKYAFDIKNIDFFGYKYLDLYINDQRYIRSPYTNGMFVKYGSNDLLSLADITTLQSSNVVYSIVLKNVPTYAEVKLNISVTSKNLDVVSLNSTGTYYNQEGILVKIPSDKSENVLQIYAQQLVIKSWINSSESELLDTNKLWGNQTENYFKNLQSMDLTTDLISIQYVTYMGETYIKFSVKNPVENRHYIYDITDNFSEKTNIIHIYGETIIEKEISSKVDIIEAYSEKGFYTYYSTEDIVYRFNTAKYTAHLTISVGSTSSDFAIDETVATNETYYSAYIDAKGICTLTLMKAKIDLSTGKYGGCVDFKLELTSKIDGGSKNIKYFEVYNVVPIINLWGSKGESQNDLFNKGRMYSSDILITYSMSNSAKYGNVIALGQDKNSMTTIKSSHKVSEKGTYYLFVCYDEMFKDSQYNQEFEFTITDKEEDYYTVVVHTGDGDVVKTPTGNVFKTSSGYIVNTHYFVNSHDYDIYTNSYLNITSTRQDTFTSDGFTTITYLISNAGSNAVSKYYTKTIAITIIPESTKILSKFAHNVSGGKSESLLGDTSATFVAEKGEKNKTIVWLPYFGVQENIINVKVYYEKIDENSVYDAKITTDSEGYSVLELTTSGTYYLQFSDLAGNIHYFDEYDTNEYFTITYLKSVIFKVQGETPINYATYNDDVVVSIDAYTLRYYNSYAKPTITVLRNGEEYKPQRDSTGLIYTFTESGLYKVWFSAELTEKGESTPKSINEEPIFFNIIRVNESNTYYSITKYADYLIEKIEKGTVVDGEYIYQDVTDSYTNKNMGEIVTYSIIDKDGNVINKSYLRNLTLSYDDYFTGVGRYKIYIRTNNEFNQSFSYEVYINKQSAPINISVDNLGETTKEITITFNTRNMIEAMGDCILKITGKADLVLTKELLESNSIQSSYEIILDENLTYVIEIRTIGGNLLESYRVTKNAPLNTITIVLIVVSSVALTAFIIIFILLRKKMKIR